MWILVAIVAVAAYPLVRLGWFLVDVYYDHTDPFGGYYDHFDKRMRWHSDKNDIMPEDMSLTEREARRGQWRMRRSRRRMWGRRWQ